MLDVGCSINTAYSLLGLWPLWFGPQMGEHTGSPLHAINWIRIPNSTFHIPHSVLRPPSYRAPGLCSSPFSNKGYLSAKNYQEIGCTGHHDNGRPAGQAVRITDGKAGPCKRHAE